MPLAVAKETCSCIPKKILVRSKVCETHDHRLTFVDELIAKIGKPASQ